MTIDYVTGMGIFLIAVAFVFQFIYGLFIPLQSNSEIVTLTADRASTILVERMLVPDRPQGSNVIDQGKLYYINNMKLNSRSNPPAYNDTIHELGLSSPETYTYDINISVVTLSGTIKNQSGPVIPEKINVGNTKRLVWIMNSSTGYNESAYIFVRVW
jgi:hypothetical protein